MNLLILNWRCPYHPDAGGAEQVTLKHAKTWAKKGIQVTWLSGNYQGGKRYEKTNGIDIFRFGNQYTIYFIAPFIYYFFLRKKFDLVIDEIHGIPFLTPLWLPQVKKIAYIHEVAQEIWDEMFPFPINWVGKLYEKLYLGFYKKILFLTASNSTKKDLIFHKIPSKNITVLPHGLFIKTIDKSARKEDKLTFFSIGRIVKMKGIEETLKIFSLFRKQYPKSQLWIAGKGKQEYIDYLKTLAEKQNIHDSIAFFGHVSEEKKLDLYRRSHFLLHTSIREGFGLTVIEANSQGTPALVIRSPGLVDILKEGENGFFIDFSEENIKRILSVFTYKQKYKLLCKKSIKYSKSFDWQKITTISYNYIQSVFKKNRNQN